MSNESGKPKHLESNGQPAKEPIEHNGAEAGTQPKAASLPREEVEKRLIEYVNDFAWHYGRYYHLPNAGGAGELTLTAYDTLNEWANEHNRETIPRSAFYEISKRISESKMKHSEPVLSEEWIREVSILLWGKYKTGLSGGGEDHRRQHLAAALKEFYSLLTQKR